MNLPAVQPPRCRSCQAILDPPGHVCTQCNTLQRRAQQELVYPAGPPKSVGVAVVLSLLWLGAGHLYAGRTGTGVALAIFNGFLVLLGLTFIGMFIALPLWLLSAPVVMALSASAVKESNWRRGQAVS
jgi:TM2 domain-containing membrane protein YozV